MKNAINIFLANSSKITKMDVSCITLSLLLLIQMAVILTMLNPIYDVRKITKLINGLTKDYKRIYMSFIMFYFTSVLYLGMYIPLQSIHKLIFNTSLKEYDKLILLHSVEKNYITAGFSLFLVVVIYGVKALLSYTASLSCLTDKQSSPLIVESKSRDNIVPAEPFLPNLLRVKRSISYETILFTNELREQLKNIIKSVEYPQQRSTLSSILEASNANL
ncbi:uncharacterized protein LOC142978862 [Anticarsia gemmatalis]|uniref:uncharacterized protein LOC142978862 n=1 Tax=Anticarsia gemmatalis TaxID=129554 RepID=UPI003F777D72